ncbi:MAG: AAA family ATPase, partial [Planctomycetota bacterium]|nr:AAA family ATPase [Planctomycetota bacterium]
LLREVLFGFPQNSPYAFAEHRGEMSATASIDLADGRRGSFRRRKGNKRVVQGELQPGGEVLDSDSLKQLLGGASADLYDRLFAFSLEDLARGEEGLAHSQLQEALFGISIGGMPRFLALQKELDESIATLYSPKGRSRPQITRLLAQISDTRSQLRDVSVRPHDYQQLVDAERHETHRMREVRLQIDRHRVALDRLERLQQSLPLYLRLQTIVQENAQIRVPQTFPHDGGDEFQRHSQRRGELMEELQQLEHARENLVVEYESCHVPATMLAQSNEIVRLYQLADHCEQLQADMPRLVRNSQMLQDELNSLSERLFASGARTHGESPRNELLSGFLVHLERTAELEQQQMQAREARSQLVTQQVQIQNEKGRLEKSLSELNVIGDLVPWQDAVDRQTDLLQYLQREKDLKSQLAQANRQLEQLEQQVCHRLRRGYPELTRICVPCETSVREFDDRLTHIHERQFDLDRAQRECQAELAVQNALLKNMVGDQAVPDRLRLVAAKDHRDQGWLLIRQHYLEQQDQTAAIARWSSNASSLAEAMFHAILQVDDIYEQRQARAQDLANEAQIRQAITRLAERSKSLAEEQGQVEEIKQKWHLEWVALWSPSFVDPQLPRPMMEWLQTHTAWNEQRKVVELLRQQFQEVVADREELERPLRNLLEDSTSTVVNLVKSAVARLDQIRSQCRDRDRMQAEVQRRTEQLGEIDIRLTECQRVHEQAESDWRQLLNDFGLPTTWSAASVRAALAWQQSHGEKQQLLQAAMSEIQTSENTIQQFLASVRSVQEHLPDLEPVIATPVDQARRMYQSLQEAQLALQKRNYLEIERTRLDKLLENKSRVIDRIEQRRRELFAAAEVSDEMSFLKIADAAARHYELSRASDDLQRQVKAAVGTHDTDSFFEDLEKVDTTTLDRMIQEAKAETLRLDQEYRDAVARVAVFEERVQAWSGQSRALEVASELESLRGKLRELVDQWAPLVIGRSCMKEALARFEREHQPALLEHVNRIFVRMTGGRYRRIRRLIGDQAKLVVETRLGEAREPSQLSTGTREQLYLAVRLAFVQRYCSQTEPLPLIMDDVLVNFDDQRATETLRVIAEMGKQHQILFLTCHEATVRKARSCLENLPVHNLEDAFADRPSADFSTT